MGRFKNTFPHFLYRQLILSVPQLPKDLDLSGQTAIVTGSNSGLGYQSAKQLINARLSVLIMAVRSHEKGIAAASQIRDEFMRDHPAWTCPRIKVWVLDMASYESVLAFTKRARAEAGHVDIAILNAGVQPNAWRVSAHGHEEAVQVNYLSTALLALELRKTMHETYTTALKSGNPPKKHPVLEIVGSDATTFAKWNERAIADKQNVALIEIMDIKPETRPELGIKYEPFARYCDAKVMLHAFFMEFVRRLESPSASGDGSSKNEIAVTLVTPGLCRTSLSKEEGVFGFILAIFVWITGRPPQVGARTLTLGAIGDVKEHGRYLCEGKLFPQNDFLESELGRETTVRLWGEMVKEFKRVGVSVEELMQ